MCVCVDMFEAGECLTQNGGERSYFPSAWTISHTWGELDKLGVMSFTQHIHALNEINTVPAVSLDRIRQPSWVSNCHEMAPKS